MTGDDDTISREVKTTIASVVVREVKEDTLRRTRRVYWAWWRKYWGNNDTQRHRGDHMWVVCQKALDEECSFEGFWWGKN